MPAGKKKIAGTVLHVHGLAGLNANSGRLA